MSKDEHRAKYFTADHIRNELASRLSAMGAEFKKSDAASLLGVTTSREKALLTDALNRLGKEGVVSWDRKKTSWRNNVHQ